MPRKTYIHRDEMLRRVARMPARRDGESDKSYEHRKAVRAGEVEVQMGLTPYSSGGRARQYCEAQVDRAAEKHVRPIAA